MLVASGFFVIFLAILSYIGAAASSGIAIWGLVELIVSAINDPTVTWHIFVIGIVCVPVGIVLGHFLLLGGMLLTALGAGK